MIFPLKTKQCENLFVVTNQKWSYTYCREREKEQEKRDDRSPARRISPQRRRARPIPRYMVQIPKYKLNS